MLARIASWFRNYAQGRRNRRDRLAGRWPI